MVVVGEVVGVVVGGGGDVIGVVVGGGGGAVTGGGAVAGFGAVAGVGDVEGVVEIGDGVAGALDADGEEVVGGVAMATTDHVPQVSVTSPCTCPAALSPENQ